MTVHLSGKTIEDTCNFIVASYIRDKDYSLAFGRLSGLSLLLVGHSDKRFVNSAINSLDKLAGKR